MTNKISDIKEFLQIYEEAKDKQNHDELFDCILKSFIEVLDVDIALHFHYEQEFTKVMNERLKGSSREKFKNKPLLCSEIKFNLFPTFSSDVVVVNDINIDVIDKECKEYWQSLGINSFMIYSPGCLELSRKDLKISGGTLVGVYDCKKWSNEEVDFFKLLIDSSITIYKGIKERNEVEASRRNYIATLTHDLRTPIVSGQKVLEYLLSKSLDAKLMDVSDLILDLKNVNEELLALINNILMAYHFESGVFKMSYQKFDIKDLVEETMALMVQDSSKVYCDIEKNIPEIFASRENIKRVILNIVSNSIKHNDESIEVDIKIKQFDKHNIIVSISDNGVGIKEEIKNKIFDRYVSAKESIGSGLGLYLSKQIINSHKGKIWVESKENEGTTFFFTLPINQSVYSGISK